MRFSLRTLSIGVLLIGSARIWWMHQTAWYPVYALAEQPAPISQFGFSPDGKFAFTVTHVPNPASSHGILDNEEDLVAIFDARNGELLRTLRGGSGYGRVWFSPLGSFLQLDSFHRNAAYWKCAWNVSSGKMIEALGKKSPDLWVSLFSPDERFAIVNVYREAPVVVSIPSGDRVAELPGLSDAHFSHRSERLVIPSNDGVLVYETKTWKMVGALAKGKECVAAQFSPDDRWLAISSGDMDKRETSVFDVDTHAELFKFEGWSYTGFSPDGRFITMLQPSYAEVHELTTGRVIVKDALPGLSIQYSTDGKRILAESGVWNADTGEVLWRPEDYASPFKYSEDYKIYSKDGKRVILKAEDSVVLASAETGEWLFEFPAPPYQSRLSARISPDSTQIITAAIIEFRPKNKIPHTDATTQATIWRRRRPEYWWGVAWLPEFWLTALFAGALVRSVWRDRRPVAKKTFAA